MSAHANSSPNDTSNRHGCIEKIYAVQTQTGALRFDEAQLRIARRLDDILTQLRNADSGASSVKKLWRKFIGGDDENAVRGAYVHGAVGRGKTLLMDMFVECAGDLPVRRAHFHDFMKDAHRRLRRARSRSDINDPTSHIAEEMADAAQILCFDEMEVHDVADAMLLGRLFEKLFARGVTLICTSNAAPDHLYKEGLQREHILPFIALLKDRCHIEEVIAPTDYRTTGRASKEEYQRFFCALDDKNYRTRFADAVQKLCDADALAPATVLSAGREITFSHTAPGFLSTTFAELCRRPLGAGDYAEICSEFNKIALADVPVIPAGDTHPLLRLIYFIDVAYEKRIALFWSASCSLEEIYPHEPKPYGYARMASRLIEMQSHEYTHANIGA